MVAPRSTGSRHGSPSNNLHNRRQSPVHRPARERTSALPVPALLLIALVSLLLGLGLSAWRKVEKDTVPAAQEHNHRLEQAADPPRHEPQQLRVGAGAEE